MACVGTSLHTPHINGYGMLKSILNIFGSSPFAPLKSHMEQVAQCVHLLPELFQMLHQQKYSELEAIGNKISELEHQADLIKNDIRNHLPKTLFLPIDRGHLLQILSIQDSIADASEDIAVLTTLKQLTLPEGCQAAFDDYLRQSIDTFDSVHRIILEMHELLESSFGGVEAQKVSLMVEEVALKEHRVDLAQRVLLKQFYKEEAELTYTSFFLWQRIFEALSAISNLSENLALRVRMTLELK